MGVQRAPQKVVAEPPLPASPTTTGEAWPRAGMQFTGKIRRRRESEQPATAKHKSFGGKKKSTELWTFLLLNVKL